MSVTVNDVISYANQYFRDSSNDVVTAAERLQAVSEATVWLMEQTTNDHVIKTYDIDYVDGIHYYKITTAVADLLEPADLRREDDLHVMPATRKSSRELIEDIANQSPEFAFGIERRDGNAYLLINSGTFGQSASVASFDTLTADGGTWAADTTTSDALNVGVEVNNMVEGGGAVKFDIDVSQSANNRATLSSSVTARTLSDYEDVGTLTLDVYIPDSTFTSSVTLYWGTDDSNYWSLAQTTDANGNAIASGWNKFKFNWKDATKTLSPDANDIQYIRVDINYSVGQGDDTGYRLDNLKISMPERLRFYYLSTSVGKTSGGVVLYRYGATTDVPYFSGTHDHYIYPIAHKAASIMFRSVGLLNDSAYEETEANKALLPKVKIFPSSMVREDRSFKNKQTNFRRRKF
jgi:hypothetical protein